MESKEYGVPAAFMTIKEFVELFKVGRESVVTLCQNGKLEGAVNTQIGMKNRWSIPKPKVLQNLAQYEEKNSHFYSIDEFAKVLGVKHSKLLTKILTGEVPIIEIIGEKNIICVDTRNKIIDNLLKLSLEIKDGTFLSINDTSKLLNISTIRLIYIRKKYINDITEIIFFGNIYINKQTILSVSKSFTLDDNYLSTNEAAEMLQITSQSLRQQCIKGNIPNAKMIMNRWFVPKEYIDHVNNNKLNLQQNYRTIVEFAALLGLTRNAVYLKIQAGLLPHFIFKENAWRIKIDDIPIYEEDTTVFTKKYRVHKTVHYSKENLIKNLNERISKVKKKHLKLFTKLFLEWCEGLISNSRAKYRNLSSSVSDFVTIYTLIISLFPKDFGKDTPNQTKDILTKTEAKIRLQQRFSSFLNYAYGQNDISPPKKVKISKIEKNEEEKEIYSPEIYNSFNLYVRELDKHIPKACKSPKYANMWIYVTLHLTDIWRHSDLIEKIPNINLEQIGVDKHTWFKENRLSLEQCQKVVNELYLKLRPEVTNKTRSFLTFLVEPTLIEIVGHAVVISEIHRRKYKAKNLLFTFVSSSGRTMHLSRTSSHLQFFEDQTELKVFKNQMMNNSTMTYLHYSIIEDDTDNADVALSIPQQARSHLSQDSSRIYVSVTNKDGSVNQVSLNILMRGNFGWLFNYMIIQAIEGKNAVQTLVERSKTIEIMREDVNPKDLENWAQHLNNQQIKRETIIKKLLKMENTELIKVIRKIFSQEMPAKTKPGQCLVYPSCVYPERKNCFGCEFFIPQYYVLIDAANEFRRLIWSMSEARYETTFIRDKSWLLTILEIFTEAKTVFNSEIINGFLSTKEIKIGLATLNNKEFIE